VKCPSGFDRTLTRHRFSAGGHNTLRRGEPWRRASRGRGGHATADVGLRRVRIHLHSATSARA